MLMIDNDCNNNDDVITMIVIQLPLCTLHGGIGWGIFLQRFGIWYRLSYVACLAGTQFSYFWRHWETCRFIEVFASWDFVWVASYLGFYALSYHVWFLIICLLFYLICLYSSHVQWVYYCKHIVLFYSIKLLLPI